MKLNKNKVALATLLAGVLWLYAAPGFAHIMTERYIPIGQSPGISGKYSHIGVISAFDAATGVVTVDTTEGQFSYTVNKKTKIWIDRNQWKMTNLTGSYHDCEVGRRVEVMYLMDHKSVARWIKVEARQSKQSSDSSLAGR